jgi:metallo-beta-lactamase class B
MKKSLITAAFVLTAIPAFAQQNATWTAPFEPFKVIDNVYYVGSAGLSSWLITTPQGDILLDVGVPQNATMVEEHIQKLGFKLSDIKILLNSHGHFDHSGGMAKLKADTGATVISSVPERYALEHGVYPGSESSKGLSFPPVKVDRTVNDGETVELGGETLTAHITPGHTQGCTTWTWDVHDGGKTYRVLAFCSASIGVNRLAPNPQYPGIVDDYRKTFAKMKTMKADIYLAPHAEMYGLLEKRAKLDKGGPNPFIDPNAMQRGVSAFETAFNTGLAEQEAKPKS